MRAICESCAQPQPLDWRPGDLCGHCGLAVREEVRCFWCARWTPKAKFCRKCGATAVATEQYGAARMLKHMGASVFEVPKLLAELDPELLQTHQAIYTTHLAAANRHIQNARELAEGLYGKQWDAELEEELLPQLPWPDAELVRYATAAGNENSPLPRIRSLAFLAQVQRGDFDNLREVTHLLHCADAALAAEAALQLSGWRVLYTTHAEVNRHELIRALRQSPWPAHAAPRLAALGAEPCPDYGRTGDADTDFLVTILEQNIPTLESTLDSPDPMRRYVAAMQLIRLRHPDRIGPTLRAAAEELQVELLRDIHRNKTAVPVLHDDLFWLVANTTNGRVCAAANQAILLAGHHADAIRLLELNDNSHEIVHSLLLAKLQPKTLFEIGTRLIAAGKFSMKQWGWDRAASPGAMPVTFVEDRYPHASSEIQPELLRFAELQIEAHGVERSGLERFLIRQCFASAPLDTIGTAWACIHRVQMHRAIGHTVPCDLSLANVEWCWTMPELLTAIASLLANPAAVRQTFVRDDFDRFLRSAEPEFFAAAAQFPRQCERLIECAALADPYLYAARFAAELQQAL